MKKAVTLTIEDVHYEILFRSADLRGEPSDKYLLDAAKSAATPSLQAQDTGDLAAYEL